MSKELNKALVETICSREAIDFASEFVEIGVDAVLKDGLLNDIPILGTVAKLYDFGSNISNRLFANKLLTVLQNFGGLNEAEKAKIRETLSKAEESKIGEELFLITDKLESYKKSTIYGKVLKAYLLERISKAEFDTLSYAVINSFLNDLNLLLLSPKEIQKQDFNSTARLYQLSLFECPLEIIDENGSELNGKKYCLSPLGVKFVNIVFGKEYKYEEKKRSAYYRELEIA